MAKKIPFTFLPSPEELEVFGNTVPEGFERIADINDIMPDDEVLLSYEGCKSSTTHGNILGVLSMILKDTEKDPEEAEQSYKNLKEVFLAMKEEVNLDDEIEHETFLRIIIACALAEFVLYEKPLALLGVKVA